MQIEIIVGQIVNAMSSSRQCNISPLSMMQFLSDKTLINAYRHIIKHKAESISDTYYTDCMRIKQRLDAELVKRNLSDIVQN